MAALSSFLVPRRHHFGLSIARTSLRAVELDPNGKIKTAAEVQFPDTTFKAGVVMKKDTLIAAVKKLLETGKFSTRYVSICFSEAYAFTREYRLPIIEFADVREAISWHVKDLFPFPPEDIYFDWKLLAKTETEYQVVVVAVLRSVLDPLYQALQLAGLSPLCFQPGAEVIRRLLTLAPEEFALVTEINQKGAYVTLVAGARTLFTTVVNYTQEDTPETYFTNINQTISEITRYYKDKGIIQSQPVQIILTGELATDDSVKKIQEKNQFPAHLLKTPIGNPAFNKSFAVAAAPISLPDDETSINLLPVEVQEQYDRERNFLFFKSLLIRVSAGYGMLVIVAIAAFIGVKLEHQQLDGRVKQLSTSVEAKRADTQNVLLLNAQANSIVSLAPLRVTPRDKLNVIASLVPEGVTITQWEYDDAKLQFTIGGEALDRADLLLLKSKLEESDEFIKINLPLGSLETPKNVLFNMTFVTK